MKYLVSLLLLIFSLSVYAGEYEDAMNGNKNVLLYLYASYCKTCDAFTPFFNEIKKTHQDLECIMVDADSRYGRGLMRKYRGYYIPYILLANPKTKKVAKIQPSCAVDTICLERALKGNR